jgi:hypothetical protein
MITKMGIVRNYACVLLYLSLNELLITSGTKPPIIHLKRRMTLMPVLYRTGKTKEVSERAQKQVETCINMQ